MTTLIEKTTGLLAFVRTVDAGSFSAAARMVGASPSAISKSVAKLEERLGARLFLRTTRSLSLTAEGATFYERASSVIRDLEEAEAVAQGGLPPRGLLRVSAPVDLGRILIASWSAEFAVRHPALRLELQVSDRLVDLARESIDVAVRMGDLTDSSLKVTRIGSCPFIICGSPAYLARRGSPDALDDLSSHDCLRYVTAGRALNWHFFKDGRLTEVPVTGPFDSDDGGALVSAAGAGAGLVYVFRFQAEEHLRSGRLRQVLADQQTPRLAISALHASARHVPQRVRVWIEFLRERLAASGYA